MTTLEMVRGLVRAAELREQDDGGKVWDDEVRLALDEARRLGWGKNQIGALAPPSPVAEPAGEAWHELEAVINRCSMENGSNTPDFILAKFLRAALAAFDAGVRERETWYGRAERAP